MDTTNPAQEYAQVIKRELEAVNTLLEHTNTINYNTPEELAEDNPELLETITDALKEMELDYPVPGEEFDILGLWLNETVLDVVVLHAVVKDVNKRHRVEILRTCGGPRCDIFRDSDDGSRLVIEVNDGTDHHSQRIHDLDNLAAALDEYAEMHYA